MATHNPGQMRPDPGQPPLETVGDRQGESLRLTVPCRPEHIGSIRRIALDFAEHHRVERPSDVALAVSEACANVVLHAYRDRLPGPMHLTGFVDADLVYLVIVDEGSGLAPRLDSPGLGLGLPLIARLANRLEISERPPTGTVVTMGFTRTSSARTDDEQLL